MRSLKRIGQGFLNLQRDIRKIAYNFNCINVPIHVYGAAVGEILIFHSRVIGKKVFTNIV
jgi:hypothetical protein